MVQSFSEIVEVQFNRTAASKEGRQHVSALKLKEAF